ncbi:MAG: phosphoenolpyruvate--protein phosphotransferase [Alphaproteobacteria bacterium]|nr:phosphoenolpyruvate--protein phosphotransferase [Alphaproteobacteria bacterium]
MAERCFTGQPASPGLAIGPLLRLEERQTVKRRQTGTPEEERSALDQALAKAMADLEALGAVASGDGADILAFQIEMLADPALIEDVLPLITGGEGADAAWRTGLDQQIASYQAADDDFFRARASDLEDLKDRVQRALRGAELVLPDLPAGSVLLAEDLTPSHFLALTSKGLGGIALAKGSRNSHVAILARGRGLPMVIALDPAAAGGADKDGEVILDGEAGCLLLAPTTATLKHYRERLASADEAAAAAAAIRTQPAMTADGSRIEVLVNVDDPAAIDDETLEAADGVGLLRTEFLLIGRDHLPDEEEHFRFYADLQRRLGGKPLIIRTLDIGGDKPHAALDLPKETNPFLGLRGIRLCLARPELFVPQIRALLRVAANGPLQVMLPMVSVQSEIDQTRALMAESLRALESTGIAAAMPPLGAMIETPAAALTADRLDAAFFSIGSNDLIQYVMAAARDGEARVASLLDPGHLAVERLIRNVVDAGQARDVEVSLCGDMASEPGWLPLLLRTGLRKISVAPAALDRVKLALRDIDLGGQAGQP